MHYRSIADMNDALLRNLPKLPQDIDLVVGVPRSGLLAANLICLALNTKMTDVDGFIGGRLIASGRTRRTAKLDQTSGSEGRILVIDDSIDSGESMRDVRRRIEQIAPGADITYCAVFGESSHHKDVDVVLEVVPMPRMFQWNVFHHKHLLHCCVDIDGVLCCDPTAEENDDGPRYIKFLANATPMLVPTRPIGWLVTSRLEKYRAETEDWLAAAGIEYQELIMLDLPSAEERRRTRVHGNFKAEVYRSLDALLFVESEYEQAREIALASGKPVLCVESQYIISPEPSLLALRQSFRSLPRRLRVANPRKRLRRSVRGLLGDDAYDGLRALIRKRKTT
jgi:uncharacterized HAD superfamily protein/hypoxanthine phosphoribosyltransferase